jgi:hypothetical protein
MARFDDDCEKCEAKKTAPEKATKISIFSVFLGAKNGLKALILLSLSS